VEGNATLAVIYGNRDFFPDALVSEARQDISSLFAQEDIQEISLSGDDATLGDVQTYEDAKRCAALFRAHASDIDGILIVLPNFGDEKGIADTIQLSKLNVPILVQAYPDDLEQFGIERRRDAFCGKVSLCNNLDQYGHPFTLTRLHTVHPATEEFRQDLRRFLGVCRVVRGLRGARLGAIGARPNAFNTVRFSEKLLQAQGIGVSTVDLSAILGAARRLSDDDPSVGERLEELRAYVNVEDVPAPALIKMAKLGAAIDEWTTANDLDATAIQCWDALQGEYGVNACTLMSMMSERLMPSACEVDVTGALSMYALQLASGQPSALVDWNNNYGGDEDKCVLFHCGNWPRSFYGEVRMAYADVLATTLGEESTYGGLAGRVPAGPMSFARITTDDDAGEIRSYVGEGRFTDDPLQTFGSRAVVQVPGLQCLMWRVCKNGFEHHVAISASQVADVLAEAFGTYLGWEVYRHSEDVHVQGQGSW
jgi:L-fucose isomerase-like protein